MFVNTLVKSVVGLAVLATLILPAGCQQGLSLPGAELVGGTSSPSGSTTGGTGNNDSQAVAPSPSATETGLTVTAPSTDISCAVGQPVLVAWQTQGLASGATVSILAQATGQSTAVTLVTNLPTFNVGSCQVDTFSLVPGLTYTLTVQLSTGASATAPGRIIMSSPTLTITSPTRDVSLLPSQALTVAWAGQYLPSGGTMEVFLDFDRTYNSGNEVLLQSLPLPASGASTSGTVTIQAADLWSLSTVSRGVSYYFGLRVIKNGHTYLAAYAPATVQLYNGLGFNIVSPQTDMSVQYGTNLQITWSTGGVPTTLQVLPGLVDKTTGIETDLAAVNVTQGTANLLTYSLVPGHSYSLILKLMEGQTVLCVRQSPAVITITTVGSSIFITNADLQRSTDKAYVAIDNTYRITWAVNQPPSNAMVKLFLDEDGNLQTLGDQMEITPPGGVAYTVNGFNFTPTLGTLTIPVDHNYYVFAQMVANGVNFTVGQSAGKIRLGAGGINITQPGADISVGIGAQVQVQWVFTGDILNQFPGRKKFLRLYANPLPQYDNISTLELTDNTTPGLDVTGGLTQYTFDTSLLKDSQSYYIIGRLFIEGNLEEESRSVSIGRFVIPKIQVQVFSPAQNIDNKTELTQVNVTWTIAGLDLTNRLIRILAVDNATRLLPVAVSADFAASTPGSTTVDVSKLPPGTYRLRCHVFEYDALNNEVPRADGDSMGMVTIISEYNGVYDLADMSAVKTTNYSPVDGVVFEGYNIENETGYEVAGIGDINNDGFADFLIFSRYGLEYTAGNSGSAYLIYGQNTFPSPTINLNSVASPSATRPVNGTILLFPMDNLATQTGLDNVTNGYAAIGLPDISNDGKGDILIGCPDAAPLTFHYQNTTTGGTTVTDHYGQSRAMGAGYSAWEPGHVPVQFTVSGPYGSTSVVYRLYFGASLDNSHYLPGDTINVTTDPTPANNPSATPGVYTNVSVSHDRRRRGATYMLTSQRLTAYLNGTYDLNKVGSPVEDGAADAASPMGTGWIISYANDKLDRSQMMTWDSYDQVGDFGSSISVAADINANNTPQFLISIPHSYVQNLANPNQPTRIQAGLVKLLDAGFRYNSIQTGGGTISWQWPEWEYGYPMNGDPRNTDGQSEHLDVIGSQDYATLTGAAGLGRYDNLTDFNSYTTGDFDNDSVPDFVVGAPGEFNGKGSIYVIPVRPIFGRRAPVIDLADFNRALPPGTDPSLEVPVLGTRIIGTDTSMSLGQIVKPAGDFNGDGLADIIFAMPNYNNGTGRVIIMFGQQGLLGDYTVDQLDSHLGTQLPALIIDGEAAGDHFGQRVVTVNDVNGDRIDDILIAAPDAGTAGKAGCGKIYLLYGKQNIIKRSRDQNSGSFYKFVDYNGDGKPDDYIPAGDLGKKLPGAVFIGEAAGNHVQAIAPAGDVNGDGIGDFIIGSPFTDVSTLQEKAGKAYVVFGRNWSIPQ